MSKLETVTKRIADLESQGRNAESEIVRLQAAVNEASTSIDAKETAKLPQLSAELLAQQNRTAAIARALDAAKKELVELKRQADAEEDDRDWRLAEEQAAKMRQEVIRVMAPYMTKIVEAEKRLLRRHHPGELRSNGIADLRAIYTKATTAR